MTVPYFKKKKMYMMLKELVEEEIEIMSYAAYSFYRGSEWLTCATKGIDYDKAYKLYHSGYFFSLDIYKYNEEKGKYEELDRITYRLKSDKLVKEYHRAEAYKAVDEYRETVVDV